MHDIARGLDQHNLLKDLQVVSNEDLIRNHTSMIRLPTDLTQLFIVPINADDSPENKAWMLFIQWITKQELHPERLRALHKLITGTHESTGKKIEV